MLISFGRIVAHIVSLDYHYMSGYFKKEGKNG